MSTTIFPPEAAPIIHHGLNVTADGLRNVWCVYEHSIHQQDAPPAAIFVGYCRLNDLFMMREARNNSEWARITNNGNVPIMLRIVALTDEMTDANKLALSQLATYPTWPHCNANGYNLEAARRTIQCSNGQTFTSQEEAARVLGVSQSAVSQHLRGRLKAVKGHTLAYLNRDGSAPR